jgi:hypothetical protein
MIKRGFVEEQGRTQAHHYPTIRREGKPMR